jgi:small conductance mechanosensitive channel
LESPDGPVTQRYLQRLLNQTQQDSLAVQDSLSAAAPTRTADDSAQAFVELSRDISETGQLVLTGQWTRLWEYIAGGLVTKAEELIPDLIGAVFVFVIFYVTYRVVRSIFEKLLDRTQSIDAGLRNLLLKTFRIIAWSFIVVMVLSQFGVNITAVLAGLGIAGIAVGLAAKDSIENFISGVIILVDKPFSIGDHVSVEDTYGTVEQITLRSTRVRTRDNRIMVMPNVHMINQKVYNHASRPYLRVQIPFGIAYKEYPQKAREVLLGMVGDDPRLRSGKPADVIVKALGNSSIDMELWLYLNDPVQEQPVRWEYAERIREALRDAGIEIPFPHLQLYFDEAKALEEPITVKHVGDEERDQT